MIEGKTDFWSMVHAIWGAITGQVGSFPVPVTSGVSASTTQAGLSQNKTTVTTAGTPVVLAGTGVTLVESVEISARKSFIAANVGAIYVGFSSTPGQNFRVLLPGESYTLSAPAGKKINIHAVYVDAASNGDAVTWTALN